MTTPGGSRGFSDLERQSAELVEAMRLTARLLRALAPVATEMRALQEAMVTLQDATGAATVASPVPPQPPRIAAPPPRIQAPVARQTREYVPDNTPAPLPISAAPPAPAEASVDVTPPPAAAQGDSGLATAEQDAQTELARPEVESSAPDAAEAEPAAQTETPAEPAVIAHAEHAPAAVAAAPVSTGPRRTVSVTVTRSEGPLDLVRVHGALDGLEGVTGLALASYTRGRANILLDTERDPATLEVREALLTAFPEGVSGEWMSDTEYVAAIGAGAALSR